MIPALVAIFGLACIAGFVWFLYEITRLEGWPGRKWHHAYIGLVIAIVAWFWVTNSWVALLMFAVALLLFWDDASQHHVHNKLMREGVSPSEWPVSWLHKNYEAVVRNILD